MSLLIFAPIIAFPEIVNLVIRKSWGLALFRSQPVHWTHKKVSIHGCQDLAFS
jgi:hypothetical protein